MSIYLQAGRLLFSFAILLFYLVSAAYPAPRPSSGCADHTYELYAQVVIPCPSITSCKWLISRQVVRNAACSSAFRVADSVGDFYCQLQVVGKEHSTSLLLTEEIFPESTCRLTLWMVTQEPTHELLHEQPVCHTQLPMQGPYSTDQHSHR